MGKEWIRLITFGIVLGGLLAAYPAGARPMPGNEQMDRVTCEEFLALEPEDQERIAYWVDSYQVSKGEAVVGAIAFDRFDQPIGMLVEDCKATPKKTLWEKLKKHL